MEFSRAEPTVAATGAVHDNEAEVSVYLTVRLLGGLGGVIKGAEFDTTLVPPSFTAEIVKVV